MHVANPRRLSLAEAVQRNFERTHPSNVGALLCVQCRRRKDRLDFRETPWHGRAACCLSCEGDTWQYAQTAKTRWELEQAREKLRAWRRYAFHVRFQLLTARVPKTSDVVREVEAPLVAAIDRRMNAFSVALARTFVDESEEER